MMDHIGFDEESRVLIQGRAELKEVLEQGAQRLLRAALLAEVAVCVEELSDQLDADGRRLVVRNGYLPAREIQTGLGPIGVRQPRVNDRRPGQNFTSKILPPYLRRTRSLEALIPWLYLKGVSTNDFPEALQALLGPQAAGLSPSTIVRLKEVWQQEYAAWSARDLTGKEYVYVWADAIYFKVRLTDERPCALVLVGARPDGRKELIALVDGERESKQSWLEALRDLKRRGLAEAPKLAIGDGALGFWGALEEVFPATRQQRCWVHKTANVLDKLPKKVQPGAKARLCEIYQAPTKADALAAFDEFVALYGAKYPKAVACLKQDQEKLFTFFDFPAAHWQHIRSTNVIESLFATVRHRHRQTKGSGSRRATLSMAFRLAQEAEKTWRRLAGYELIDKVITGVVFTDGVEIGAEAA
jgi:transposase-like protein